jgi:hypothetical protein
VDSSPDLVIELPAAAGADRHPTESRTRIELGLPTDRRLIATGHQAEFWHPGILVKYMLADLLAAKAGGVAVHLVVDQDANDFATLDLPISYRDGTLGLLRHSLMRMTPQTPVGVHAPFDPAPLPAEWTPAIPRVHSGAGSILDALKEHRDQPNAAAQIAGALADLMLPFSGRGIVIFASSLLATEIGRFFLARMADDPWTCAQRYNEAVRSVPDSGSELEIREDRVELPLWRLESEGRRTKAWDDDIARFESGAIRLRPRALLLTALMRTAVCDLFIHGLGGRTYDLAMERWLRGWLSVTPQPMASATATLRLPFDDAGEELDVGKMRRDFRRALHDPESILSGSSPGPLKRALLEQVTALPRRTFQRRAAFRALHAQLADLRAQNSDAIARSADRFAAAMRFKQEAPIRSRRTWAFPLYPEAQLLNLRDRTAEAVNRRIGS